MGFYVQDEIGWKALTVLSRLRWERYKSDDVGNSVFDGSPAADRTRIAQRHTSARLAARGSRRSGDSTMGLADFVSVVLLAIPAWRCVWKGYLDR